MKKENIKPNIIIENKIYIVRGHKVMLDKDLAELYEVTTGNLNLAIQRNSNRFPEDFMFQLTTKESENLILQTARSSWGGRRHLPYVFTEPGVAMLSSVLKSEKAIQMNIFIIRAFVKIRELLSSNKDLTHKVGELEREQIKQGKVINLVYSMLKKLEKEPLIDKTPIGFRKDG